MPVDCIPYRNTNYFSPLICDYLDEKPELDTFYGRYSNLENLKYQIDVKQASYPPDSRAVLTSVLKEQYSGLTPSGKTAGNIDLLNDPNTFTVTTGHQLNLFTGPLYFLYKIISTINLTEQLKETYGNYNFVPVYWMATEDHDFEEINFFNFKGKKLQWSMESKGAVGDLSTEGLDEVFRIFSSELGKGENANYLRRLFERSYLDHENLADATRFLANELFSDHGLVIIDADESRLKHLFVPYLERELLEKISYNEVMRSNSGLEKLYSIQVNPREINLFYLKKGLRERIIEKDGNFMVYGSDISWTRNELLDHLKEHPESFSPNVIMRPLYQEVILPNLCYIGGGGELTYWMQLKGLFDAVDVPVPVLLLRNSVLIRTDKQLKKQQKLGLSLGDIFMKQQELINKQIKALSTIEIDFSRQKAHLRSQFKDLYDLAEQTDKSFLGAVAAQERKQVKGLENLEKRLLRAQKRKFREHINRMKDLQNQLFPGQGLQERNLNFSELYLEFGDQLIPHLKDHLEPLKGEFLIITI
jgi:bacillithiol biosynthesis cysteine-adding enzyme BshC